MYKRAVQWLVLWKSVSQNSNSDEVYMYAVIKTGGKQYRVAVGEKIKVEQIAADVGQEIVIDRFWLSATALN